jgi:predicted amidohydrolase
MIRFAIAQLNSHIANLEQNLIKATNSCIEANDNNADIIIFPELFLTGYTPQDLLLEYEFIQSCQEQLFKFKQQTKHLDLYIIIGHISN